MLNVLMYMFDNDLTPRQNKPQERMYIQQQLTAEGFPPQEIYQAFSWLRGLQSWQDSQMLTTLSESASPRVFSPGETRKFSKNARNLLLELEGEKIITSWHREIIIDRAMAIDTLKITATEIKWIVLMVLYHYQQENMNMDWLEHILLSDSLTMH